MKINPKNERIKTEYLERLKEAKRRGDTTIDHVNKAICRYEEYTNGKDFATFNKQKAMGFKKVMYETKNARTGQPLKISTINSTLNNLKEFFTWLACRPGYKSKIDAYDTDYFNLSENEVRSAQSSGYKEYPTLEEIMKVLSLMPSNTPVEKRNRGLVACTALTTARCNALATLKIRHVFLERRLVVQDPKDGVKTKFGKLINSYFFPIGDEIEDIFVEWVRYLREELVFGLDAPLFPKTKLGHDENKSFMADGLEPLHWSSTTQIRQIFKDAFTNAGLPYYSPHRFRDTIESYGEHHCKTPAEYKAWSLNLGHTKPTTSMLNYGYMDVRQQGELLNKVGKTSGDDDILAQILAEVRKGK